MDRQSNDSCFFGPVIRQDSLGLTVQGQKCGSLNQDPWFSDSMIWVSAFLSISQGGEHPKQAWQAAMGTCSWQSCLWHWFCYGPGTAWRALHRWKGPHLRRIHCDHLGDFPNIVHRKKEQLSPLNKRGPPFTSAQALLPDRMARHRGVCSWKGWDLH